MKKYTKIVILLLLAHFSKAQAVIIRESGAPSPAVGGLALPFSDARHAALGDAGVAMSPDYADIFYNPAKTAFATSKFRFYGSYPNFYSSQNTNLLQNNYLARVGAYYKIPNNRGALSLNYTSIKSDFNYSPNASYVYSSFDWALGANYAKKFSRNLSLGIGLKFVRSTLSLGVVNGMQTQPAETVATDISIFHQSSDSTKLVNFNYGVYVSNLSGRINYGGIVSNFIPTNLKIGIAPTIKISKNSSFTLVIDANKLMIPTPKFDSTGREMS